MKYYRHFFDISFCICLFFSAIFCAISVIFPTYSGKLINTVAEGQDNITLYIIFFTVICLLQYVVSVLKEITEGRYVVNQKKKMRLKAFSFFLQQKEMGRDEKASAVSFVNNDMPIIVSDYYLGYLNLISLFIIISLTITMLFTIHWILALIIVLASSLIVFIPRTVKQQGRSARKAYSMSLSNYNESFLSFLDGINIIKLLKSFQYAVSQMEEKNNLTQKAELKVYNYRWLVYNWTALVQIVKNALLLIVGVFLIHEGMIRIGDLFAVIQLSELIGVPIETLAYTIQAMNAARPLVEKYDKMLRDNSSHKKKINVPEGNLSIEIKGLSYKVNGIKILNNLNLLFEGKGKYLLVGESGSGKSTLFRLMAGLGDEEYEGEILFNGVNIKDLNKSEYYDEICLAFQDVYIFNASLKDNILLGRDINDALYWKTIERLNLGYLIERYKGTEIDAKIMEKLSGGEKQRIALARVMVGCPKVYLLDEVTSALDHQNAEDIEQILLEEDAMVIYASHNVDEAKRKRYDATYVIEKFINDNA